MRRSTLFLVLGIVILAVDAVMWSALFAGARTEAELQRMASDSAGQLPFVIFGAFACFFAAWRLRREENKKKR